MVFSKKKSNGCNIKIEPYVYVLVSVNCYYLVSVCENIIVGTHGVPDPPSLGQMTFTSMSELKFDSGAPPGGQI